MTEQKTTDAAILGSRLRYLRRMRSRTLNALALEVGCSESMLSKIERGRVTPSLAMLRRLTVALEVNISMLFSEEASDGGVVSRKGERPKVTTDPLRRGEGVTLERLMPYQQESLLQANIHIVAPGGSTDGLIAHTGEEMGYLLEGTLELQVEDVIYVLRPGDAFHFRSEIPHGYRNPGAMEARVVWVNTPPTF